MKIIEIILGICSVIFFVLFKLDVDLLNNEILGTIVLGINAIVYFIYGLTLFSGLQYDYVLGTNEKDALTKKIIALSIVSGIITSSVIMGILQVILNWKGGYLTLFSMLFVSIVLLAVNFHQFYKNKNKTFLNINARLIFFVVFGIIVLMLI